MNHSCIYLPIILKWYYSVTQVISGPSIHLSSPPYCTTRTLILKETQIFPFRGMLLLSSFSSCEQSTISSIPFKRKKLTHFLVGVGNISRWKLKHLKWIVLSNGTEKQFQSTKKFEELNWRERERKRERERERERLCVCVREIVRGSKVWARESLCMVLCVLVCVIARDNERKCVCVCVMEKKMTHKQMFLSCLLLWILTDLIMSVVGWSFGHSV